jgi:NAD(P)-dependent dehydrogenase (short-subunit alcohol dehydrogenase family)
MIAWLKKGNAAVVTGGANGIGLAAAQRFLAEGMNVLIADIDQNALESATDVLDSYRGELITQICDVTDASQLEALKQVAYKSFGRVDCLMNNAGAAVTRALPWEDLNGWKKQIDINLWDIIHGCHAFIPSMLESAEPVAVINTGSKQGITNPPGGYAYNMSKAGVINYTQSVAHALRQIEDCPVSAHLLVPGFTYSNMIAKFVPDKPPGAWTTAEVIDFMIESLANEDFYIICPDHDTPRELDNRRMQWTMGDLINNRPALSRWHPDFAEAYEAFVVE